MIDDHIREEVLYREAVAMGLDRDNTIVRRRRQKLEFLTEETVETAAPSEAELQTFLQPHPDAFRVDASVRASGIGRKLLTWAIERAHSKGCHLVQLTSDKARSEAIRFYESLGFVASHEAMKLHLPAPAHRPT